MTPLKLVFLGSDPIALPVLDWLAGEGRTVATIIAVFTQPDRPVGRGQKITANAIKAWALARGVPVFQPEKLTDDVRAEFAALGSEVALVMAYGHILRDAFIATPRLGTLNLHTSLLPKYRGASPIQTAIASGERETGVSLMRIVRKLDAGPVADVERVGITTLDTALDVEAKLAAASVPLVARALPRLRDGSLLFVPQDEGAVSHCRKLAKEDGVLDFSAPASADQRPVSLAGVQRRDRRATGEMWPRRYRHRGSGRRRPRDRAGRGRRRALDRDGRRRLARASVAAPRRAHVGGGGISARLPGERRHGARVAPDARARHLTAPVPVDAPAGFVRG